MTCISFDKNLELRRIFRMTDDASTSESRDTIRPPTPIRLGQLFECFEIGIGPYAEDAAGNLKHIDDVPSPAFEAEPSTTSDWRPTTG